MSARVSIGQRRLVVTPEAIEAWLVNGNAVKTNLPEDARFLRLWPKDTGDAYVLVFESEQWEELDEGKEIPKLDVEVEEVQHGE